MSSNLSKEHGRDFGLEGFRYYLRNQIKYYREEMKFDDLQMESAFYSDLKLLCEEFYSDLNLLPENIYKELNQISDTTRDLIKKRRDAVNIKMKESHTGENLNAQKKAIDSPK